METWPLKEKMYWSISGNLTCERGTMQSGAVVSMEVGAIAAVPHLTHWPEARWCHNWKNSTPEKPWGMVLGWRGDKDWMHTMWIQGMPRRWGPACPSCMNTMLSMSFCRAALQEPGVSMYFSLQLAIKVNLLYSHGWVSGFLCIGILLNL